MTPTLPRLRTAKLALAVAMFFFGFLAALSIPAYGYDSSPFSYDGSNETVLTQGFRSAIPTILDNRDFARGSNSVHDSPPYRYATKGARLPGGLTVVAPNVYQSPGGLIYGPGSQHGHRFTHVVQHAVADPTKKVHGVFATTSDNLLGLGDEITGLVDEAWALRTSPVPGDPGRFIIPMGREVGTAGERSITIIVRPGTSEVITAFPSP